MEEALIQAAIQVPSVVVLGYIFLRVLQMVLDVQGRKLDRLADAWERHNKSHREED